MSTLATMRNRIKTNCELNSTEYDDSIDDAIRSALRMNRGKQLWFLEKIGTVTITSGNSTVAAPSDLASLSSGRLLYQNTWFMDGRGFDLFYFSRLEDDYYTVDPLPTSKPEAWSIVNGTIYLSHTAPTDLTIRLVYYCKDTTLPTSGTDTSVWFDDGYDYIRALAEWMFKKETLEYGEAENSAQTHQYYYQKLCDSAKNYEEAAR